MSVNTYKKRNPPPTRVDLQPEEFDAILEDFGCQVLVTPSVLCPRRSGEEIHESDTNHDLNCPLCNGALIVDLTSRTYQTTAYIQGISMDKTFMPDSRFDVKDALCSFKSTDRISYWFKVEVVDFGSLFNQAILRKDGNTDHLRYPSQDFSDGTYVAVIDSDGKSWISGTDFTIAQDVLTWSHPAPNRAESGKLYSIIYPIRPTFRVLELLHENRYYYNGFRRPAKVPVQLPQQAHVRWDYLAKRGHDVLIDR